MALKSKYNPAIHHRQSIRLKGYDYSQPGAYFITICTQNRRYLLGEIIQGKMILNDAGKMVEKWYFEIENKYPTIKCGDHITMPNHFHCIIKIPMVGMALRGHPYHAIAPSPDDATISEAPPPDDTSARMALRGHPPHTIAPPDGTEKDAHVGASQRGASQRGASQQGASQQGASQRDAAQRGERERVTIFEILDWFKTMTTNEYIRGVKTRNWQRFQKRLWQLRYWDHIIRNEKELFAIQRYIKNNPSKWESDKLIDGTGNRVFEESIPYGEQPWMI